VSLTLYRARFSTNVERVALTLALKGLEAESVWITYDDRALVEEVSGQPLVPVLDYDGEILVESMDIVRELDARHPDPPLYPGDPAARAALDVFVEWFNHVWKGPPNQIEDEIERRQPNYERVEALSARMIGYLDRFEDMLATSDYLLGDRLSAADICAFPFLKFATLDDPEDQEQFHVILRDHQRDGATRPRLAAWIDRVDSLPRA
jgi:glutathione S-transferase